MQPGGLEYGPCTASKKLLAASEGLAVDNGFDEWYGHASPEKGPSVPNHVSQSASTHESWEQRTKSPQLLPTTHIYLRIMITVSKPIYQLAMLKRHGLDEVEGEPD